MRKSFTLIEILIVIAIIAILASVVFVSLNSSRVKARNARAMADLKAIEQALILYHDENGTVPARYSNPYFMCTIGAGLNSEGKPCLQELVDGGYLSTLPKGPNNKCPAECTHNGIGGDCTKECYLYHFYESGIAMAQYTMTPEQYGPFPYGLHCSSIETTSGDWRGGWWPSMSQSPGQVKRYCVGFEY